MNLITIIAVILIPLVLVLLLALRFKERYEAFIAVPVMLLIVGLTLATIKGCEETTKEDIEEAKLEFEIQQKEMEIKKICIENKGKFVRKKVADSNRGEMYTTCEY